MPTKPNSAGEQQDYVPTGNGDPSGEYADDAGANIHFHVFKKPADQSAVKGVIAEGKAKENGVEIKVNPKIEEEQHKTFESYLDSHYSGKPKMKETIKENFTKGTPEAKKVILDSFNHTETLFTSLSKDCCWLNGAGAPQVSLSNLKKRTRIGTRDISDQYSDGGVFYHECGHAIDAIYGKVEETGKFNIATRIPASYLVKLSNGKTLEETITSNSRENLRASYAKARNDYLNAKQSILAENKEYASAKEKLDSLRAKRDEMRKPFDSSRDDIMAQFHSGKITYEEYSKRTNELIDKEYNLPALKDLNDEIMKAGSSVWESEQEADNKAIVEFGDVSDMFQATTGSTVCGMGHSVKYFSKPMQKGLEFFAEYVSAKSTSPASLKRINEYFPEQAKVAEELYQKIAKGELKKWNQM